MFSTFILLCNHMLEQVNGLIMNKVSLRRNGDESSLISIRNDIRDDVCDEYY
jgi:hypothetical protein